MRVKEPSPVQFRRNRRVEQPQHRRGDVNQPRLLRAALDVREERPRHTRPVHQVISRPGLHVFLDHLPRGRGPDRRGPGRAVRHAVADDDVRRVVHVPALIDLILHVSVADDLRSRLGIAPRAQSLRNFLPHPPVLLRLRDNSFPLAPLHVEEQAAKADGIRFRPGPVHAREERLARGGASFQAHVPFLDQPAVQVHRVAEAGEPMVRHHQDRHVAACGVQGAPDHRIHAPVMVADHPPRTRVPAPASMTDASGPSRPRRRAGCGRSCRTPPPGARF